LILSAEYGWVRAVVNEIDVGAIPSGRRSDAQIARSALHALESTIYAKEIVKK